MVVPGFLIEFKVNSIKELELATIFELSVLFMIILLVISEEQVNVPVVAKRNVWVQFTAPFVNV